MRTARMPCASQLVANSSLRTPQLGSLKENTRLQFPSTPSAPLLSQSCLCHAVSATTELSVQLNRDMFLSKEKDATEVTLELLEWPRLLLVVSSFAGTVSAKELIQ
ncbi:hypothetical protein L7F22_051886, partial [Adiantum nelumboides]|nr:hypothetical protein [Adiantum nelumboides]